MSFSKIISRVNLDKYICCRFTNSRGRLGCNPIDLIKTVLFGLTLEGCASLRKLEDLCRNDIRFMFLMRGKTPSHITFSNFINNYLFDNIEDIFVEINKVIFEKDKVDLMHLYLDGSKFEANANKYSWV